MEGKFLNVYSLEFACYRYKTHLWSIIQIIFAISRIKWSLTIFIESCNRKNVEIYQLFFMVNILPTIL